jgi:CMP/dCMP kinase
LRPRRIVIAIDGPAASGKSTTARLVAERLGYMHIDTGAMYRAVTLKVLRSGIPLDDESGIARLMESTHVELRGENGEIRVLLDGEEVTEKIRTPEVTRAVSAVSSLRDVRRAMVREQRSMGREGGIVLDGRDIGTVVFPDAECKFFMVAGIEERARRRRDELVAAGVRADLDQMRREIEERDRLDSTRTESPLRKADDAVPIDTSDLSIEQQVAIVVKSVKEKLEKLERPGNRESLKGK